MSITASIVALVVMLARIPLKKAPKIYSYALWGIVLFRLIVPFSIESALSLMPTSTNIIPQDIVHVQNSGVRLVDTTIDIIFGNPIPIITQGVETNFVASVFEVAAYVWLAGFITLLVYALMGYVNLKRRMGFATLVRDNIFESDRIRTPFVFGLIHPKIYFPTTICPSTHSYILKHEQIHIKRRDYLIKPFAYIVFALHWFNPLMWIAYFLVSRDMEMSCDEAVLMKTDEDIRCDYSTCLLSLSTKRVSLLNPTAFSIGEGNVKDRIVNVLKFRKSASWVTVISVIVVSILLVGFSSDRILAIDTPPSVGSVSLDTAYFDIANWHIDEQGAKVATVEEAQEIGLYILNRYYSAFRHGWQSWERGSFSLISHPAFIDEYGNAHTQPWTGGVFANELTVLENAIWGNSYFYAPLFLFYIDTETGRLDRTVYIIPTEYIMTSIAPFEFSFDEGRDIYGSEWRNLLLTFDNEYVDMLIDFSLEVLSESGFSTSEIVSANRMSAWSNFYDNHITIDVGLTFASGKNVIFGFRVFETYYTLEGLTFDF